MIKLVVTDLDATLLDNNSKISDENIKAIKYLKNKGVLFGIASGRAKYVIEDIAKDHGIFDLVDIIIGTNGVEISDKEIIKDSRDYYLNKKIILEIYNQFKDYDVSLALYDGANMYINKGNKYTAIDRNENDYNTIIEPNLEKIIDRDFPRLMFLGEPEVLDEISQIMSEIEDIKYNFFKSYYFFLETVAKNVSKGETLKLYCETHGIDMKDVLAVGDNNNDIEMIKASGYGIAVENATEELKKHAKYITGSNVDNGVAQAIYRFI